MHCRGHLPAISGLIAKKIFRKKFLFDCRGLWADERLDNKSWNKKYFLHNWSYIFFKKLEYLFFKVSDHNVVLTSNIKNYLIKKNHFSENSFSVIPCAANYDHFKILNKSQIISKKKELNIDRYEFIIGYFGSISNIYHPNEMINFFLFCKKIYKKSLIIFFSDNFNYLLNKTTNFKKLNQFDYMCINSSYDKLPIYYNICDMTLSFVKKTKARVASSPTKIGESLACGVNVLSNKGIGDLDVHLNFNKFSLVDVKKDKELKKISLLIKYIKNLNREKIRKYSKKNYDLDLAIQTYKKIYLDLFPLNSLK